MAKILVVDDEADLEVLIKQKFRQKIREHAYEFVFAINGKHALEQLEQHTDVDVVLSDINMPEMDGLTLLTKLGEQNGLLKSVIVSAYGDMENIRTAMNRGAYDFITKPLKRAIVTRSMQRALERRTLLRENHVLRQAMDSASGDGVVGQSVAMRKTLETLSQAAPSLATILLMGESGTGKELLARAIHDQSPRRNGQFVAASCGAFPETLLESELFGHEDGAFTGARGRKIGRFERAQSGTIFLD